MKYLIYNTKASAQSRTAQIADALGCGKNQGDVTTSWFEVIEHPTNLPQCALVIPDGEEVRLTTQEQNQLKDHAFMDQQGWFPVRTEI